MMSVWAKKKREREKKKSEQLAKLNKKIALYTLVGTRHSDDYNLISKD